MFLFTVVLNAFIIRITKNEGGVRLRITGFYLCRGVAKYWSTSGLGWNFLEKLQLIQNTAGAFGVHVTHRSAHSALTKYLPGANSIFIYAVPAAAGSLAGGRGSSRCTRGTRLITGINRTAYVRLEMGRKTQLRNTLKAHQAHDVNGFIRKTQRI